MSEKHSEPNKANQLFAYGLTLSRLLLARQMRNKVVRHENIGLPMLGFIAADIADGVIARKLGSENPTRRFIDAAVDRVSIAYVASEVFKNNAAARPYIHSTFMRETFVAAVNTSHFIKTREVVQGNGLHKLGSLTTALFAVAAAGGNEAATIITGTLASAFNDVLAIDYVANFIEPHGVLKDGIRQISLDNLLS